MGSCGERTNLCVDSTTQAAEDAVDGTFAGVADAAIEKAVSPTIKDPVARKYGTGQY